LKKNDLHHCRRKYFWSFIKFKARRWRKGAGQKRSREKQEGYEECVVVRRGVTIKEKMVWGRVGRTKFHKIVNLSHSII
jgi:hypothetical protein